MRTLLLVLCLLFLLLITQARPNRRGGGRRRRGDWQPRVKDSSSSSFEGDEDGEEVGENGQVEGGGRRRNGRRRGGDGEETDGEEKRGRGCGRRRKTGNRRSRELTKEDVEKILAELEQEGLLALEGILEGKPDEIVEEILKTMRQEKKIGRKEMESVRDILLEIMMEKPEL